MSEKKSVRLNKLAKEFNVGMDRILAFLDEKGLKGIKQSSKISHDLYMDLLGEFHPDLKSKLAADVASKEREYKRGRIFEIIDNEYLVEKGTDWKWKITIA